MFRGVTALTLDDKGRMAIPRKYRGTLQEQCSSRLVITIDKDRCLLVYPFPEWQEIERQLNKLPSFNKAARSLQRLYIGHASETDMDGQGRVLLPPALREFANLRKQAVLIGQGNKFELWDEEAWNRQRDSWLEQAALDEQELPPELEKISL